MEALWFLLGLPKCTPGLNFKVCKCIFPLNKSTLKMQSKKGNAEERPDADCEITRWKMAAKSVAVFFLPSEISQRINLSSTRVEHLLNVKLQTYPQNK